jgi:hypothetical protein
MDILLKEIAAGRLRAMNIGGLLRIGESDLKSYLEGTKNGTSAPLSTTSEGDLVLELRPASDFTYKWPQAKGEEPEPPYQFDHVREGVARFRGKEYRVKLGFTVSKIAGQDRRGCVVWVERYPTVQFAAANAETGNDGPMASVLKDRNNKHIPVGAEIPPEYEGFQVAPYREIVDGPRAATGLAVICGSSDFDTMIRHALIRHIT